MKGTNHFELSQYSDLSSGFMDCWIVGLLDCNISNYNYTIQQINKSTFY